MRVLIRMCSDPDNYRFRIIPLPQDITAPPHSEEMGVIYIGQTTPGDPIRGNGKHVPYLI